METRSFVLKRADGSVAVMCVVQQGDGTWPAVEECLAKWAPEARAAVSSHRPVDGPELPTDLTFRNAWRDNGSVFVDMPAAREIWRDKLREMRAPILAALDADYMRADEAGDAAEKRAIALKKQALRDVTADPAIEAAQTPEQLKAVIPDALK